MEFPFYVTKTLVADSDGFVILNARSLYSKNGPRQVSSITDPNLVQILDRMGEASSRAQGLGSVITTYSKFMSSDHRLYLKVDSKSVLGLLKVGEKNLFYHDNMGNIKELHPLCVLDFYVHESMQRMGVGKELFEKMLQTENVSPAQLAYDRPSPKLIGFLKKHYGLMSYIPQNNNFVIFNQYFDKKSGTTQTTSNMGTQGAKDKLAIERQTTNPLFGGSLKKPVPLSNQTNTQLEFHNVGRQILSSNYSTNNFSRGLTMGSSPSKQEFQTLLQNQTLDSFPQGSMKQTNRNIISNGTEWSKNTSENTMKAYLMDSNLDARRGLGKDKNLFDVQEKLKRTEDDILRCKERIEELTRQKNTVGSGYTADSNYQIEVIGRGRFQQRIQDQSVRQAPWATHHDIPTYTSSASYGNHLQYPTRKYY